MKKKEILFITSFSEHFEDGLSYAIYLAGTLGLRLNILILGTGVPGGDSTGMPTTAAFTNPMDADRAFDHISAPDSAQMQMKIRQKCDEAGINSSVHTRLSSQRAVIRDFLGRHMLDMVLLSPSLSGDEGLIKGLLKESSRPVVTLTQDNSMAAGHAK